VATPATQKNSNIVLLYLFIISSWVSSLCQPNY